MQQLAPQQVEVTLPSCSQDAPGLSADAQCGSPGCESPGQASGPKGPEAQPSSNLHSVAREEGNSKCEICFDFTKGMCTRGDKCKFSHDLATIVSVNSREKGICFDFLRPTGCNRGLLCRFSHDLSGIEQQCAQQSLQGSSSADGSKQGGRSNKAICFDFVKGLCDRGPDCRYSHDLSLIARTGRGGPQSQRNDEVCYDFLRGRCERGASCKYSHNTSLLVNPAAGLRHHAAHPPTPFDLPGHNGCLPTLDLPGFLEPSSLLQQHPHHAAAAAAMSTPLHSQLAHFAACSPASCGLRVGAATGGASAGMGDLGASHHTAALMAAGGVSPHHPLLGHPVHRQRYSGAPMPPGARVPFLPWQGPSPGLPPHLHHQQGLLQQQVQDHEQAARLQGHQAALARQLAVLQRQNQLAADAVSCASMPLAQTPFAQPSHTLQHGPPPSAWGQAQAGLGLGAAAPTAAASAAAAAAAATQTAALPQALAPLMAPHQQQQQLEAAPLGALRDVSNTLHRHASNTDGKPLARSALSKALSDADTSLCGGGGSVPLGGSSATGGPAGSLGGSLGLSVYDSGRLSSGAGLAVVGGGSGGSYDGSACLGEHSSGSPAQRAGSPLSVDVGSVGTAACARAGSLGSGSEGAHACMSSSLFGDSGGASPRAGGVGGGEGGGIGGAGLAGAAGQPPSGGAGAPGTSPLSLEAISVMLDSCRHDPAALAQVLSRMALEAQAQANGAQQPAYSSLMLQHFAPFSAPAYAADDVLTAARDQQLPQHLGGGAPAADHLHAFASMGISDAMPPGCHGSNMLKSMGVGVEHEDESGLSTLTPDLLPLLQEIWNR